MRIGRLARGEPASLDQHYAAAASPMRGPGTGSGAAGTSTPNAAPIKLWVADATYVPTAGSDFLYLAVVLDVFSRRVVGWAMGNHLRTAADAAGPGHGAGANGHPNGVIHHSDQGCQYTSLAFGRRLP